MTNLVEFHKFYFVLVGGIFSFVLSDTNNNYWTRWALTLPFMVSVGASLTFSLGLSKARELQDNIAQIAERLGMVRAHAEFLVWAALVFAMCNAFIAVGCLALFWLKQ